MEPREAMSHTAAIRGIDQETRMGSSAGLTGYGRFAEVEGKKKGLR
jgi:hypothetical protein